ncbi:MAG: hypothetical protein N3A57_07900, partial [Negativicutes bacterium]|nr:hypothetical protein [Negativicutes bacterium]
DLTAGTVSDIYYNLNTGGLNQYDGYSMVFGLQVDSAGKFIGVVPEIEYPSSAARGLGRK